MKNKKFHFLNAKTVFFVVLFLLVGLFFANHFVFAQPVPAQQTAGIPAVTGGTTLTGGTGSTAATGSGGGSGISDWIANTLSFIVGGLISTVGVLLMILMKGVIFVAQYNDFTSSAPVTNGWVIVRDLCNMFFILILLLIAFATILRVEGYDIKKMVPKLIIMAVLINFSKTICGLIIDFAQVIMNAFLSPIAVIGPANITSMLGLQDLMKFSPGTTTAADSWKIFGAYVFALAYVLIASVVLLVIFAVLIVRVIMLWIYIVLSPLSYLLATFPQGQKYVSQWWDEFTKNVIVGPVLAFFLWLSFISLGNSTPGTTILGNNAPSGDLVKITDSMPKELTSAMTLDALIKFAIAIGMLVGGLIVTQQMGGYMGKIAGQGMAKIQGGAKLLAKGARKAVTAPVKYAGGLGIDALQHKGIVDLNIPRAWKGFQERRQERKASLYNLGQKQAAERLQKTGIVGGALALTAMPRDAYNQLNSREGLVERLRGGKRTAELRTEKGKQLAAEEKKLTVAQRLKEIDDRSIPAVMAEQDDKARIQAQMAGLDHDQRKNGITSEKDEITAAKNRIATLQEGPAKDQAEAEVREKEKRLDWMKQVDADIGDEKGEKADPEAIADKKAAYTAAADPVARAEQRQKEAAKRQELAKELSSADLATYEKEKSTEPFEQRVRAARAKQGAYAPFYNAEARNAGQQAEAVEGAKTKDILDSDEKLRMLISAIKNKNQPAVRAIFKQMAMNGDDNEALQPLVGDTSAFGIQKLMRALSGTCTKEELAENPDLANLNAGFSEQDSMALGSEIGMINKQTNHWNATAPYKMRGGVWEKSTEKDMSDFRSAEISKMDPQVIARAFNRLAYGRENNKREFKLDAAGVISLRLLDNENGIKQIDGRMTQNTATKLTQGDSGKKLIELAKNGILSQQIVDMLFKRARTTAKNPAADLDEIHKVLG
ncbi:MAG: hypothetical protein PHE24_01055 [Patescibacteria group bacterium]|nr:hypothetical protein [Patescibacteria group bacterium]